MKTEVQCQNEAAAVSTGDRDADLAYVADCLHKANSPSTSGMMGGYIVNKPQMIGTMAITGIVFGGAAYGVTKNWGWTLGLAIAGGVVGWFIDGIIQKPK